MFQDLKELLSVLNEHRVKYLVVGAYAACRAPHKKPRNRAALISGTPLVKTCGQCACPARSTFELFAVVKQILDKGRQFQSLAEPRADACAPRGTRIGF